MQPGKVLRGGIIGCGYFAQHHLEAWRRIPSVMIVAACDREIARARTAAPHPYSDPEQMLNRESLDFLDIVTTPESHLPLARLLAERRIPAICQKPMAQTMDEAREMVALNQATGVSLMIHENWRWQPWYRHIAQAIRNNAIGEPVAYWFRFLKSDGNGPEPYASQPYFRTMPRLLIFETLVHHIDVARFLFGDIESVYALVRRRNTVIAGEDQAHIVLRHIGGLDGAITGHRFLDPIPDGPAAGETGIEGTHGSLTLQASGDLFLNGELLWRNTVTAGYRGDSVGATQRHFIECLLSGKEFETGVQQYLQTFAAVDACYESARTGCAVPVSRDG